MSNSSPSTTVLYRLGHRWQPTVFFVGAVTAAVRSLRLWLGDRIYWDAFWAPFALRLLQEANS